jgi:Ser/Thr protein kinase RdoA (MazF antagonist)
VTHFVHGMGKEPAEPDWPPLTSAELAAALGGSVLGGSVLGGSLSPAVTWHSPRPLSAAALVELADGRTVFVKRHHQRVRSAAQLAAEHAFTAHLRAHGQPVPQVLATAQVGEWNYEFFSVVPGIDVYRDAVSWSPYLSTGHAAAAGAALASLHLAAADFSYAERPFGPLMTSTAIVRARDPMAALGRLGAWPRYPALRDDFARHVRPLIVTAGPSLRALPRQWGHGDWHPSNLTWTSRARDARVAGVFDLGLANLTSAVYDLAVALERSVFSWLDFPRVRVDLAAGDALIEGYQSLRPLSPLERTALPLVLPVVHVEYALSELEYFTTVVHSDPNADLAYDYLIGHARWFADRVITNRGAWPRLAPRDRNAPCGPTLRLSARRLRSGAPWPGPARWRPP